MGQGTPGRFHSFHGSNIRLKDNRTVAERTGDSRNNAIVFTEFPIDLNKIFQITILKISRGSSFNLVFGITTEHPSEHCQEIMTVTSLEELLQSYPHTYWCVGIGTTKSHFTTESGNTQHFTTVSLSEGDTVGLIKTPSGYVHLLVNNEDQHILWINLPEDIVWGVVELSGNVAEIKGEFKYDHYNEEIFHRQDSTDVESNSEIKSDGQTLKHKDTPKQTSQKQSNKMARKMLELLKEENFHLQQQIVSIDSELRSDIEDLRIQFKESCQLVQQHETEKAQQKEEILLLQTKCSNLEKEINKLETNHQDSVDISFWEISHKQLDITDNVLGRGGWGEVKVGIFCGQKVAVKQIYPEILSPHYTTLVQREISLMAKVRHPNLLLFIAAVLNHPSGSPVIVTELLDTSLRNAYQNSQIKNPKVKLLIMRDVALALNYLHLQREPIIHRDVSSSNVLLEALPNDMWKGKLSDFGSANLARLSITAGPGAEVYTAPEVPRETLVTSYQPSRVQTPKIDVYSYGVLLCELLTSQFPLQHVFPNIMKSLSHSWPSMHYLVSVCIHFEPTRRPDMEYILMELNKDLVIM